VSTFLLTTTNSPNLSNAYGCANSTTTNHTAGINGTSGNTTTKSSASTGSNQIFGVNFAVLPPEVNTIATCHSTK
jgi:hypothetical protein